MPQPADPGPPAPAHREVWCRDCGGEGKRWRERWAGPDEAPREECLACEGTGMALVPDEGDAE